MIYAIPVVGWLIGLFFHISLAVPFWICWNAVAPRYFADALPAVWLSIGFWDSVALFVVASILKAVLMPNFKLLSEAASSAKDKSKK